jgi:hypothetical protein
MRGFPVIEVEKTQGRGRVNFWNVPNHLHRASHTPPHKWAEVLHDHSTFRQPVALPVLRVPKPDA